MNVSSRGSGGYFGAMCGRFAASASRDEYVDLFSIDEVVDEPQVRFNIAPTDAVSAVVERVDQETGIAQRKLVAPRWGLVPSWAKDTSGAARLINARVETVAEKPSFRKALAARRCLIPCDGYYEWYVLPGQGDVKRPRKQPYFIHPRGERAFVMAGLYEFWRAPTHEWLTTCTIITTTAHDAWGHLHDRMPLTVPPDAWADWLAPGLVDGPEALDLLSLDDDLDAYPVSTLVNAVRNDGPHLVEPIEPRGGF